MWDVLSALIPPAVVAAVFCTAIYKLLRREMAPRTSDGRRVRAADSPSSPPGGAMRVPAEDTAQDSGVRDPGDGDPRPGQGIP